MIPSFKTFLIEISLTDHFEKYIKPKFPRLPFNVYQKIAELDPTTRNNQRGKYVEWLISTLGNTYPAELFDNKDNITKALERFDKYPAKYELAIPDTNDFEMVDKVNIQTITDTQDLIYYVKNLPPTKNEQKEQDKEIFNDKANIKLIDITDEWIVAQPLTHQGNIKLARYRTPMSAKWCTGDPRSEHHFDSYNERGILIDYLNRKNPMEKYQLFYYSEKEEINEARDFNNGSIPNSKVDELYSLTPRVKEFYGKIDNIEEFVMNMFVAQLDSGIINTRDILKKIERKWDTLTEVAKDHIKSIYNTMLMSYNERTDVYNIFERIRSVNDVETRYLQNPTNMTHIGNLLLTHKDFDWFSFSATEDRNMDATIETYNSFDMLLETIYLDDDRNWISWFNPDLIIKLEEKVQHTLDAMLAEQIQDLHIIDITSLRWTDSSTMCKKFVRQLEDNNESIISTLINNQIDRALASNVKSDQDHDIKDIFSRFISYMTNNNMSKNKINTAKLFRLLTIDPVEFTVKPREIPQWMYRSDPPIFEESMDIVTPYKFHYLMYYQQLFVDMPTAKKITKDMIRPLYDKWKSIFSTIDTDASINGDFTSYYYVFELINYFDDKDDILDIVNAKFKHYYNDFNDTNKINSLPDEERRPAINQTGENIKKLMTWFHTFTSELKDK